MDGFYRIFCYILIKYIKILSCSQTVRTSLENIFFKKRESSRYEVWMAVIKKKILNKSSKAQSVSCWLKEALDAPTQVGSHRSYTLDFMIWKVLLVVLIPEVIFCSKYHVTFNQQN